MAQFKIPESPTFNYLDLNNLQGMDSWNTNPSVMRSPDMLNVVKKDGVHQVRHTVKQSYLVDSYDAQSTDDINYDIKYIGEVEEYDENGNPVPYYIKISEYLGGKDVENESRLCISVWPTPKVSSIALSSTVLEPEYHNYLIDWKFISFTNYGISGNRQGLYEHINYDGKEWVFTPIGILSFRCSEEEIEVEGENDTTIIKKQLHFTYENVMDNPYIPTVIYGSTPDGLDFTKYESINLLSDKRKAQFLGDATSTAYQLPEKHLDPNYCKVMILDSTGTYVEQTSGFTLNGSDGIVTFTTAPGVTPVDGKDNVIIEYKKLHITTTPSLVGHSVEFNLVVGDDLFRGHVTLSAEGPITQGDGRMAFKTFWTITPGSNFDSSTQTLTQMKLFVNFPGPQIVPSGTTPYDDTVVTLNQTSIDDLNDGDSVYYLMTHVTSVSYADKDYNWEIKAEATYLTGESVPITVIVPGSAEPNVSANVSRSTDQFSWMGFNINPTVSGKVGNNPNGSDSYWEIKLNEQLWLSRADYLYCNAGTLYCTIDGVETNMGSTGNMYGTSTRYPSNPLSITKRIPYQAGKTSVNIRARMTFYANISGQDYYQVTMNTPYTINLPQITLPHEETSEGGETLTETAVETYFEYHGSEATDILYDNIVPGSARLGCYYGAKCVTVYGYESDRRVFVSDGTNKDTYSGVTMDGTSSIYYFPDDNYNVLGEDTEILGYAQKNGYLLTFKRGEDSVYVRYGTSISKDTVFPSTAVTRNLQVLTKPIQINDEILVVTRGGIKSINFISNEVRAELRSYFINNYFELGADYDYDKMSWFAEDNLLYIFLNNYEFTADLVSKSYVREGSNASGTRGASTLDFQYEWYVSQYNWSDNQYAPQVTVYQPKDFERQNSGIVYDKQRPIGYTTKGVFEFSYDGYKIDELQKRIDDEIHYLQTPIPAHYITPFLNMGAINIAKTIKYVYINTHSQTGDEFYVGYIDENGETETIHKEYTNVNDYGTKFRNHTTPFPKLIQIKSKIRKFMNVKLYIQNRAEYDAQHELISAETFEPANYCNMTFDRILVQYQVAGKYRGE